MRLLLSVLLLLAGIVLAGISPASAAAPYTVDSIMLLQPQEALQERIDGAEPLAAYIKALNAAAQEHLRQAAPGAPASGYIVVAVRADGARKIWLDYAPALPAAVSGPLRAALERVAPMRVRRGAAVFAINASLWGGARASAPPSPEEWRRAAGRAGEPVEVEDLVLRIFDGR
ncbi:hypothetical protein [Lysobacter enzymogenes]|uniref:hypothetical protein n=1 Tax=Lysobacter enzymogenes TaxID=69 RepID=UPI0008965F20|nr:hypothetical protein [Lysobacter enzymogenes]SDY18342.1 hypothetical protein SAMN05421681_11322 [Lysobacter enzymogenes]